MISSRHSLWPIRPGPCGRCPGKHGCSPALRPGSRHSLVDHAVLFALLVSEAEIVISHPRFYWGETGNVLTPSLFDLPIPASRSAVRTGYQFVLPDQNGWSRYLHFQAAWVAVLTGMAYLLSGLVSRHFKKNLIPAGADLTWRVRQR